MANAKQLRHTPHPDDLHKLCNLKYWELADVLEEWMNRTESGDSTIAVLGPIGPQEGEDSRDYSKRLAMGLFALSFER